VLDLPVPSQLRDRFSGALLTPVHPAYDTARRVWNGRRAARPVTDDEGDRRSPRPGRVGRGQFATFLSDEGTDGVRRAFGPGLPRLVALKDRWDPTNLFDLNVNITPSEGES
jgi:Berberine and berberine like